MARGSATQCLYVCHVCIHFKLFPFQGSTLVGQAGYACDLSSYITKSSCLYNVDLRVSDARVNGVAVDC